MLVSSVLSRQCKQKSFRCVRLFVFWANFGTFPVFYLKTVSYSVHVIKADGCQLRVWWEKGGISPLYMKECWVSVNIVIVGFIAVITLFLFASVSASSEVFRTSGTVMSHFYRFVWSFPPRVKIVVLYDVLIGHCATVTVQASEGLRTLGPTCMEKKETDCRGSAKPDDLRGSRGRWGHSCQSSRWNRGQQLRDQWSIQSSSTTRKCISCTWGHSCSQRPVCAPMAG